MSSRPAALAWGLWLLSLALTGLTTTFHFLSRGTPGAETTFDPVLVVEVLFPAIGAFIASRRPENPMGWILLAIGLLQALNIFAGAYGRYAILVEPGSLPGGPLATWIEQWTWLPSLGLLVTFLLLLFPDGHLPSRRWRWVARLAAAGIVLTVLGFAASAWPERGVALLDESDEPGGVVLVLAAVGFVAIGLAALACVASLFIRLRRATGDERQQLKWFLSAGGLTLIAFLSAFLPSAPPEWVLDVAFVTVPIAATVAILRYRLYEIDLLIRRTLVYGVLSAGLAGLYFGIVIALQQVFSGFAGGSDLAVAGSTLVVAALFRPARQRIQELVDRRFYRRKVDAARTLEAFSARLRQEIDLDTLRHELLAVVDETMQPAGVSLWLRGWQ